MKWLRITLLSACAAFAALGVAFAVPHDPLARAASLPETLFPIQSIDTMKDSRDSAGEGAGNAQYASLIASDMALVKESGANYVAIDTPYDDAFLPVLKEWVAAARSEGLSIWFRGNFSGWEGWFGYPEMTADQHAADVAAFLKDHMDLFESGDIFSPCPECENGALGDPRSNGDLAGYRRFLIDEYAQSKAAFAAAGKDVLVLNSENYDVAKLVMDASTTAALGGFVAIDDYVATPDELRSHVQSLMDSSKGTIILGEFGAPIPDINGSMTEDAQAAFVGSILDTAYGAGLGIAGVNYWDLHNGSTALLDPDLAPRAAFAAVQGYYAALPVSGVIRNGIGERLGGIALQVGGHDIATSSADGAFRLLIPREYAQVTVLDPGGWYASSTVAVPASATPTLAITLAPKHPDFWYRLRGLFYMLEAQVADLFARIFG